MQIKQFYDKGLAHASYAVLSEKEIVVIDPERDPAPYLQFAKEHEAKIIGIIETHLHADFVSSHLELSKHTGAKIYVSKIAEAEYPHTPWDEGNTIFVGNVRLICINTPGHSPDSISILLVDQDEKTRAVFTGDTLFVGDVGRPDLRESSSEYSRHELAELLYHSLTKKLLRLPEETIVYPAHGPGSLCGKSLGPELESTIGKELKNNTALGFPTRIEFIENLLKDQPFVPSYFPYNVLLNRRGSENLSEAISVIQKGDKQVQLNPEYLIIDTRVNYSFQEVHLKGAINIQLHKSFETWLGTIVRPEEHFYIVAENKQELDLAIRKAAKIGYEQNIAAAFVYSEKAQEQKAFNQNLFIENSEEFTIVDVRTINEHQQQPVFIHSINIPLHELRQRVKEIPLTKPVVVHCAAGTRSAIASSIIQKELQTEVFDLGESIKNFQ